MLRAVAQLKFVIGITLLALALAACADPIGMGDGDGGGGGGGEAPVIDSATMLSFANAASALMQTTLHTVYSDQGLETPDPFLLPSLAAMPRGIAGALSVRAAPIARAASPCPPVTTGVDTLGLAIDSDGDGIPDDFTADFGAGCTFNDGGQEITWSGGYRLQDTGSGVLDFSYTPTDLSAMERDTATGFFFRQSVTSVESAHFTPSHAAHQMDATREITAWTGGDTLHVVIHTLEGSTYDPDAGSIFSRHSRLQQGTLGFGAVFTVHDLGAGTDSVRFVYSTPTPIHIAFDCGTGIDAGKLQGLLEGDARVGFRFVWTGCITPAPELFGTTP
jgi:hypothetical protein